MKSQSSRRQILGIATGGVAGLLVSSSLSGRAFADSAARTLRAEKLGDSFVVLSGGGGNFLVAEGRESLFLVDTGAKAHDNAILHRISQDFGSKPIITVFNTHWHLDHTGANEAFAAAGAEILAHMNTKLWMSTEFYVDWQDRTYPPRSERAVPTRAFYSGGTLKSGKNEIEYGHLPRAHTDGDIFVFFPDANILAAGDVVSVGQYPLIDYATNGTLEGMVEATKKLLEVSDPETRIIPGIGPIVDRAHLKAEHDMLSTVRDRMQKLMSKGLSAEEIVAAGATKEFDEAWGDPSSFIAHAYEAMYWDFPAL